MDTAAFFWGATLTVIALAVRAVVKLGELPKETTKRTTTVTGPDGNVIRTTITETEK